MSVPARTSRIPAAPAPYLVGLFPGSLSVKRFDFSGASLFEQPPIPEGRLVFSLPDDWYGRWSITPEPFAPPLPAPAVAAEDIVVLTSAATVSLPAIVATEETPIRLPLPASAMSAVAVEDIVVLAPAVLALPPVAEALHLPAPAASEPGPGQALTVPVFDDRDLAGGPVVTAPAPAPRADLNWIAATGLRTRMLPPPPRGRWVGTADRMRRAVRSVGTAATALQRMAPALGRLAAASLVPQTIRRVAAK